MTTEQYSIGYDEGYQAGWNAAMDAKPAQQEQNRQVDQLIQERDHRDEIIDKLCDAVLGPDRYEWSSQYFFEDAVREVEERTAEQRTTPQQQQKPVTDKENEKFRRDVSNFAGADPEATKYALEEFLKNRTSPPAQRKPLTDEDCTRIYNEANGITIKNPPITTERIFKAMRAAHGIKENT